MANPGTFDPVHHLIHRRAKKSALTETKPCFCGSSTLGDVGCGKKELVREGNLLRAQTQRCERSLVHPFGHEWVDQRRILPTASYAVAPGPLFFGNHGPCGSDIVEVRGRPPIAAAAQTGGLDACCYKPKVRPRSEEDRVSQALVLSVSWLHEAGGREALPLLDSNLNRALRISCTDQGRSGYGI